MNSVTCPGCENKVSSTANQCPQCGYTVTAEHWERLRDPSGWEDFRHYLKKHLEKGIADTENGWFCEHTSNAIREYDKLLCKKGDAFAHLRLGHYWIISSFPGYGIAHYAVAKRLGLREECKPPQLKLDQETRDALREDFENCVLDAEGEFCGEDIQWALEYLDKSA